MTTLSPWASFIFISRCSGSYKDKVTVKNFGKTKETEPFLAS